MEKPDPVAAGMSAERLARIAPRMKEFVDAGKSPGIVTLVARHGQVASLEPSAIQDLGSKDAHEDGHDLPRHVREQTGDVRGHHGAGRRRAISLLDPVEKYIPGVQGTAVNKCGTRNGFECQLSPAQRPSRCWT